MTKFKETIKNIRKYLFNDDRKLKFRIFFGAFVSFAFVLNFFLYGPIDIYLGNSMHFVYSLSELLLPVLLTGAGAFAVLLSLCFLLKGRSYNWYITLMSSLSFASYLQVMFMNKSVVLLDGTQVEWEHQATSAILGLLVWVGVILLFYGLLCYCKKVWKYAVSFVSVLICFVQIVSIVSGAFMVTIDEKSSIVATSDGELEISSKHNVVVLSVDSFDIRCTEEVMENSPEYFDEFDGFTWYKNTISHNSRTFPNIAVILTGKECLYDKEYEEYMEDAWKDNRFLEDIKAAGYDSRLYIKSVYVNSDEEYMMDYTSNYKKADRNVYSVELEKKMIGLSMYRSLPVALKPFFETDTSELNGAMAVDKFTLATERDERYYKKLREQGLSISDSTGEKGTFTYFHFNGCHAPFVFDENCMPAKGKVTSKEAARGALTNISEYLRQLKEQGVYDNSTIIITTDHAYAGKETELERERVVTLFYKPANARGEIVIDNSPQQLWNIRPTVLKAMGLEYASYGTPFDEVAQDADIKRYFYMSAANEDGSVREHKLLTYEVVGDANDFNNWKLIDKRPIEFPYLKG
ncbi:MAG: sulfatase-like hydrolase/transferase [Ruminococcus sp.]|nr:sulfatase-like hydrolase/transferase [Ruminococcus sp.]